MFTGLIEEKGKVTRTQRGPGGFRLCIEAPVVAQDTSVGDSVSVNGACLTAVSVSAPVIQFDVVKETAERSTLGDLVRGQAVNLERPLRAGARMGGHMVLGHVDAIGVIREIRRAAGSKTFRFDAPQEVTAYVVQKGSIAVDGISLTIADCGSDWFSVAVIPHTLANTTLGKSSVGGKVNLEADIIGKYVSKFAGKATAGSDERMLDLLSAGGFLE